MSDPLIEISELAYVMGLQTLGEAVGNFELHALPVMPYAEANEALRRVHAAIQEQDLNQRVVDILGPERVAQLDKEQNDFFDSMQKVDPPIDDIPF